MFFQQKNLQFFFELRSGAGLSFQFINKSDQDSVPD